MNHLLHPLERDHLGNQKIHHIPFDPRTILQGAFHIFRKTPFVLHLAARAHLDFGVYMTNYLLENDIDLCTSLAFFRGNVVQTFTTELTIRNLCNLGRFYCTGIAGQYAVLFFALAVGSRCGVGFIFTGLGGRYAGVEVVFTGFFSP